MLSHGVASLSVSVPAGHTSAGQLQSSFPICLTSIHAQHSTLVIYGILIESNFAWTLLSKSVATLFIPDDTILNH